jgi:superfamily II DNA or RNA helicase
MLLKIGLSKSQIIGNVPPSTRHALRAALSYENKGQIIQRMMWKKRTGKHNYPPHLRWDGITRLITEKYVFPSGLLSIVRNILNTNGLSFTEFEDFSEQPPYNLKLAKEIELWAHQRKAIDAIKQNKRGVIRVGTGGGKSISSIVATQEIGQLPVLFVVNRVSLLKQAHKDYEQFLGEKIGFIGDGIMDFGKVNIATVHTLCSILKIKHEVEEEDKGEKLTYTEKQLTMLRALLKSCRMVIVDECHHSASDMYVKLMENIPNAVYRIGMSATPFLRSDGLNILVGAAFGPILYEISASELIKNGTLAKPYITFVDYEDPLSLVYPYLLPEEEQRLKKAKKALQKKEAYNRVYKDCVVENELFHTIVAKLAIVNAKMKRLTLISVKHISHGSNILETIKKLSPDVSVEFLNGINKNELNEDKIKEDFSSHKIQILISTLFDEGVDIPAIDVAIDAGGGASAIKTLQLAGRTMRKYPGKTQAHVFIFVQRYTHLYNHSLERLKILQTEEEFEITRMEWPKNE